MSSEPREVRVNFGFALTPVVRVLLWINSLVYLFLFIARTKAPETQSLVIHILGLTPRMVTQDRMFWQPLTYMFVHQEFMHVLLNMFGLWWLGSEIERYFGSKLFWRYYLFTGIGGAVAAVLVNWDDTAVTLGASGAIFGLLTAYGFLFPNRTVYIYGLLPVKAVYCVLAYGLLTVYLLLTNTQDGVSHIAHFGGMAFGIGWFLFYQGRSRFATFFRILRKRRMRRKLRLIRRDKERDDDPYNSYSNKTLH